MRFTKPAPSTGRRNDEIKRQTLLPLRSRPAAGTAETEYLRPLLSARNPGNATAPESRRLGLLRRANIHAGICQLERAKEVSVTSWLGEMTASQVSAISAKNRASRRKGR
jgi:hypothetical protein